MSKIEAYTQEKTDEDLADQRQVTRIVRLGFVTVLTLIIVLGLVGVHRIKVVGDRMANIVEVNNTKVSLAFAMRDAIRLRALSTHSMLSTDDVFERDAALQSFYSYAGKYRSSRQKLSELNLGTDEVTIQKLLTDQARIAQPINRRAAEMLMKPDVSTAEVDVALRQALAEQQKLLVLLDDLIDLQKKYAKQALEESRGEYQKTIYMIITMVIGAVFIGFLITRVVARFVSRKGMELAQKNAELAESYTKAEEATKAKSEFLANMSHEIRTPMNGVLGMLSLLKETRQTSEQEHFTNTAYDSAEALLTIINDILDFSKIEAGKLDFENVGFNLVTLVEDILDLHAENARSKNIELINIVHPDVSPYVSSDPTRLRQLLNNLMSNALKFTEEGEIILRVKQLESSDSQVKCLFEVQDTGLGIADEAQSRIFESFTQADGSTTRNYGGTGLGLAICKQLVNLFGGEIGFNSSLGEGSTFWFTAIFQQVMQVPETEYPMQAMQDLKVMVVDDNESSRLSLHKLLRSWGANVQVIDEGPAALLALNRAVEEREPYDVVLVDSDMPELDGYMLMQYIRENPRLDSVKAILMNQSAANKRVKDKAKEAGFDRIIKKPVRHSTLHNVIAVAMGFMVEPEAAQAEEVESLKSESLELGGNENILLVEDNLVNQRVASSMLAKLGCNIELAGNGEIAIEKIRKNKFDLVFMDCQMPTLDGFAATRKIREMEAKKGLDPIVIIAMTANAMEGDRQRCLDAGMNDYLGKPVKLNTFKKMLRKWLPSEKNNIDNTSSEEISMSDPTSGRKMPHLDGVVAEDIIECLGMEAFHDIANLFIETAGELVESLGEAFDKRDKEGIHYLAHTLKGSSGNIGASQLFYLCERLDSVASSDGEYDTMENYVSQIRQEFGYLINQLKKAS